jgi:CHU_C Type IX secretion signal domain
MRLVLVLLLCMTYFEGMLQCGLTKTYTIQDQDNFLADTTNVSIIVDGALDNNLSAPLQGLCGVKLKFRHPFMKELFIELISPAGEKIILVGGDIVATNTPLIVWDVTFVPQSAAAAPDPGFLPKWENDQLWQSLSTYTGQYYPYTGNLEDFDLGTVNGTWTLRCIDFEDSGNGTLLDAELSFCQSEGISCGECFLNPGLISNPDLFSCQGDTSLDVVLNKVFPGNQYNPTLYDYSNVIFKDSTIFGYQENVNLTMALPGAYTICGVQSYKLQSSLLPMAGSPYDAFSLDNYFFKQGACASVSDSCMKVTINVPIPDEQITKYICEGQSYMIHGRSFDSTGFYNLVFEKEGCDSLVRLDLKVIDLKAKVQADRDSINCIGNTIALQGTNQGTIVDNLNYRWFTSDGIIEGNINENIVDVKSKGTYFLELSVILSEYECRDTTSIEIFIDNSFPAISLTNDTLTCLRDTVLIRETTSIPAVSKTWSSKDLSPFFVTDVGLKVWNPGWYYLSIIADNGCGAVDSVFISQDIIFQDPLFSADTITCSRDTVQINVLTNTERVLQFSWEGVNPLFAQVQNPVVSASGTYTVTITDDKNGCNRTYDVNIIEDTTPPTFIRFSADTITCAVVSVTPIWEADQDISSFLWTGPGLNSTSPSPVITQGGLFNIIITSSENGCSASSSFEVVEDTFIPDVTLSADMLTCLVDSVRIVLNADPLIVSANWQGPVLFNSTEFSPKIGVKGLYTVLFTGENGCVGQQSIAVENSDDIPETIFQIDSLKCGADTIQIKVLAENGVYSYFWEGPGLLSNDTSSPEIVVAGVYKVTITDINTTCTNAVELEVADDRIYTVPDLLMDTLDCTKDSIQIMLLNTDVKSIVYAGPGYNSTVFSPFVSNTGAYTFTLTNNKNCISTGTFEVVRNDTLPVIDKIFNPIKCGQDSILLQGISSQSGTIFTWKGPLGYDKEGTNVYAFGGGTYILEGVAPNGCKTSINFEVGYDTLSPVFEILLPDTITCRQAEVELNTNFDPGSGMINWSPGGLTGNGVKVTLPGQYIAEVVGINNCKTSKTIDVMENKTFPTYESSASAINCKDILSNIKITPTSPFTSLIWSDASNPDAIPAGQLSFNTSFDGIYTFVITNEEQCSTEGQVGVIRDVSPPVVLQQISDTIDCFQPVVTLGVVLDKKAISYLWNGPNVTDVQNDGLLEITEGGQYYLKITGENHCVTNETFDITKAVDIPVYDTFTDTLTCDKGKINIGIIPFSSVKEYHWTGPEDFKSDVRNPKIFLPGMYTVTVTGINGCTSVSLFEVEQDIKKAEITIQDTILLSCDTSAVTLTLHAENPISRYKWIFPSGNIITESSPATTMIGTYRVQVTGVNGCPSDEKVFYVGIHAQPPGFTYTNDTVTCREPIALLRAGSLENDVSYQWRSPSGGITNGDFLTTASGGFFTLLVTNSNKCKDSVSIEVMVDTTKNKIIVDKKGDIQCDIKRVVLDASATALPDAFKVNWSTSTGNIIRQVNDFIIEVDKAGSYMVQMENLSNGCISNENIEISETPQQFTQVDVVSNPPDCDLVRNGKILLTGFNGIGPFMVSLNGSDRNGQTEFINLSPGVYRFEIKDSFGCKVNEVVTLGEGPDLQLDIESDLLILFGDSLLLKPQVTPDLGGMAVMKWFVRDSLICSGCTELWIRPFVNTIYTIEYAINGQCKEVASVLVKVKNDIEKSIPNIFLPSSSSGNNRFYIPQVRGINNINSIRIFDRWAENVYMVENILPGDPTTGWDGTFNGKDVQPGVFIVFVELVLSDGTIWKYQGDVTLVR